jgi:glc operon protein GlcG
MSKITLEEAREVVRAGLQSGREQGVGLGVAVVDYAGQMVAFERDDTAMWIASEIAWRKARTSAAFCSPTADREQAWAQRPFFAQSVVALGDFVVGKGAIPLIRDGEVVGAVGASGGHPDQDHLAAEAGAARFASL